MPNMITRFVTWRTGKQVGEDQFGNRYYVSRKDARRRWVVYKGLAEGSKTPPLWNAWLHHTIDDTPATEAPDHDWELQHVPNLTGTPHAYRPQGHVTRGGRRAAATGDYQAWSPEG